MKKLIVTTLLFIFVSSLICSHAVVHTIYFDWEELGARKIGVNAVEEDYFGENVHNLRCNYSNWDHNQEYLWLVSDWSRHKREPGWIYIGKHDMSIIDMISFFYVTDGTPDMTNNKVSLTKDQEGTQVVATAKIEEATLPLAEPKDLQMEILEPDYNGDLYVYIEYSARMFVGNLEFVTKDDGTTPTPAKTPTPKPQPTEKPDKTQGQTKAPTASPGTDGDGVNLYVIGAVTGICVLGAVAILIIWRTKKK